MALANPPGSVATQDAARGAQRSPATGAGAHMARFVAFLVSGGVAALVNLLSRFLLSYVVPYAVAIIIAYCVGMLVAFGLMRSYVFQRSGRSMPSELGRFALVNVAAVAQTLGVSLLIARWLAPQMGFSRHAEDIGHLFGVGVPVVTSYFGHRSFSFKR